MFNLGGDSGGHGTRRGTHDECEGSRPAAQAAGVGWRVHGVLAALNHGTGVHLNGGHLSQSNTSWNGQQGVSCGGANCVVTGSEAASLIGRCA